MIGEKIGNWTIINNDHQNSTTKHKRVICKCDCGKTKSVLLETIKNGKSKSCGCLNTKHGKGNTRLYKIWKGMKVRCLCKTNSHYKWYGERGITICNEWLNDFMNFYEWSINNGYKEGLTIDRINNDGNYEPSNCRWVDTIMQSNNCRTNIYFTLNGIKKTLKQWCREYNINYSKVYYRVNHGWTIEDALEVKYET